MILFYILINIISVLGKWWGGRGGGGVGDEVCECGAFICMLHVWVCIYVRETETDPSEC